MVLALFFGILIHKHPLLEPTARPARLPLHKSPCLLIPAAVGNERDINTPQVRVVFTLRHDPHGGEDIVDNNPAAALA